MAAGKRGLLFRRSAETTFHVANGAEIELILNLFWETSLRSEGGDDNIRSDALGQLGHSLCLLPIFCALMEEYDEEDARSAIAEDWVRDRRGRSCCLVSTFATLCSSLPTSGRKASPAKSIEISC